MLLVKALVLVQDRIQFSNEDESEFMQVEP